MHRKNFSPPTGEDGINRLTPADDLACTRLAIPDDRLALPVLGKTDWLDRVDWLVFAKHCNLSKKPATRVIDKLAAVRPKATPC